MKKLAYHILFLYSLMIAACSSSSEQTETELTAHAEKIVDLDSKVDETSGLIFFDDCFWTINDSGDQPRLYRIHKETGQVIQTVRLSNGTNIDWEDISQDNHAIYISDTGNNHGTRKDFTIYKINKSDIDSSVDELTLAAEIIHFNYEDQPNSSIPYAHDFDCEALTMIDGQPVLFTKNWKSNNTHYYQVANGVAKKHSAFETNGLVTGAHYDQSNDEVLLIGYEKSGNKVPFMVRISSFHDAPVIHRYRIHDLEQYQTESICIANGSIYISNEENGSGQQALYTLNFDY